MKRRHGHPPFLRLLKHTVAAFVLAAAFTDAASAGLPGLGGTNQAPPAPLGATVDETVGAVTGTTDGTLVDATTTTTEAVGAVESAAAETTSQVEETVDATVTEVEATVDAVVADTAAAVEPLLEPLPSEPASGFGEPVARVPAHPKATSSPAPDAAQPPPPALPAVTPPFEAFDRPAVKPTSIGAEIRVRTETPAASRSPRITPRMEAERSIGRAPRAGLVPEMSTSTAPISSEASAVPVPQGPAEPPTTPASVLRLLFSPPGAPGLPVVAALLGLLALAHIGCLGARLRPALDLVRPPDVLFPLERPG